ncbi:hypothetical protein PSN45_002884 [Yamadazyma tenuis]|uniref:Very-long-chain (3R)-3-hydroxyacyl-CoA dehydratase n=1 Tax=Candida tenuis (strain ATCC 10573 / BCRC 21748 / CBS 615 / JCM 9827 / NBRC 10315 / NRRL Y-1498 / VKM Y-70) TaxID=590646 RepID=G3AWD8_CANTC|nr:uncharacterized protein CANTEDRAFT_117487 [Yamadazyma tenuis ATCC 10573]EGV66517.1 hypothetical protein CANTEDRAFT_117487 [Yamadazyma tenuis ATCC 10573]WEJ95367.1 hypothetical protein PSN45_002884 [Yamadazyma tenuis]
MAHLYPLPTNLKFAFAFNVCSFTVWFCCLCRFLILLPLVGRRFLPGGIADFFHAVSVLPLMDFLIVKTTISFKFSATDIWPLLNGIRMAWVCFGVIFPHPTIAKHTAYSFLILSWCTTYIIHYTYYAFRIKTRSSPYLLFWLNYNHYWVTFPMAIVSEMVLVFLSLGFVNENSWLELAMKITILVYIPIGYFEWEYINKVRIERFYDLKKKMRSSGSTGVPTQVSEAPTTQISRTSSPHTEEVELRNLPNATRN